MTTFTNKIYDLYQPIKYGDQNHVVGEDDKLKYTYTHSHTLPGVT